MIAGEIKPGDRVVWNFTKELCTIIRVEPGYGSYVEILGEKTGKFLSSEERFRVNFSRVVSEEGCRDESIQNG